MKHLLGVLFVGISLLLGSCGSKDREEKYGTYEQGYGAGWGSILGQGESTLGDKTREFRKGYKEGRKEALRRRE